MAELSISSTSARTIEAGGSVVKPRHLLSAVAMLVSLLAGWLARPTTFEQRFVSMPAAISWQTFQAARAAAQRPSFCPYAWFEKCRVS